jgi:hypothetical protein
LMKPDSMAQSSSSRTHHKQIASKQRIIGNNRRESRNISQDAQSIADFDESEWTQQDSAYGAACPVCGFIPKHVRRMIEFSMIAGMVLGFVYLLVTTSIHITNDRNESMKSNTTSLSDYYGGQVALDDDVYVEYNRAQNDDNTYWVDDDANNDTSSFNDGYTDDVAYQNYLDEYGGGRKKRLQKRI